ncbi:hypothetical protein ACFYRC_35185 [Streptomyces sp. NPDC005279]|uniref:hypothetical protein n=1 Tax=Streptomyces sp. NPDC005279 TaxID=3364712 RepID=UPI0036BE7AE3
MPSQVSAAQFAREQVGPALDSPDARREVLCRLYKGPHGRERLRLPYRRAASAFMDWQVRRGLLRPLDAATPGSTWWRAVNQRLLSDGWEALGLCVGMPGEQTTPSVAAAVQFIRAPSPRTWYRAHNLSVVSAYLEHRELAETESRTERFFMNVVLLRVLYAHALVSAPRLALGRLRPAAPFLGDPRLGMTGIFLSISRVLPDRYPLGDDVETYVAREHGFGRLLDHGVITPRLDLLYDWSARTLAEPRLAGLLQGGIPVYNWPAQDAEPWRPQPSVLVRAVRRGLPASRRSQVAGSWH